MAVELKAEAVITAKDATGETIERVTGKLRRLNQAVRAVGAAPVHALNQAARVADRVDHVASKVTRAIAGGYAAAKAVQLAESIGDTYAKFDDLVRYQRAVMGITKEQQKPFIEQAIHMGAATPFNDLQVLQAQLDLAQRGVASNLILPIIAAAADFGQAMNVELPEAARTIEGILFSTGKAVTDGNAALALAKHAVDEAAKMAKIGGFTNDDVREFFKYAGLAGSTAGLSDPTIGAVGAIMHRANIGGEEAGVAVRALAGRLVAPTKEGLDALAAMGIDYNKYTSMPGGLSATNLQTFMTQRFGRHVSASGMAAIAGILGDPEVMGDRSKFISAMFEALSPGFGKGKHGKMRPQDARELTKAISDYYKDSVEKVDSEALLRAIIDAHPTLGQLNAFLGQKQGSRVMAALRDRARFDEYYNDIKNVPEGFAKSIGDERMGGYAGSQKRAAGSWMNVETALGRAWDEQMTGATNAVARLEQAFVELDQGDQRLISGAASLTAVFAGLGAASKVMELGLVGTASVLARFAGAAGLFVGLLELAKLSKDYGGPSFWKKFDEVTGADKLRGWNPFASGPQHFTTGDVRSAVGLPAAEIKGSADVNIQIEPSDSFISRIVSAIRNEIANINVVGPGSGVGTAGSTGLSMPEAMPGP